MENSTASGHYVDVQGLVKLFGNDRAVDDVSFSVPKGKFLTLLGPSGCGKTTTLMSIAGLHRIDAGRIRVGGVVYTAPAEGLFLPPEKRDIGMVFQSYAIWPHMTVAQNVAYPLEIRKVARAEIDARVADVLKLVGLGRHGGQARNPAVGRSAATRGAGARDRVAAAPAAVRRATVQPRPQAARADAARTQAHPARSRHHVDLRHARSGRGAGDERRDHRHEQGPHPAARRPARDLRVSRPTPMSATSSASPIC